MDVIDVFELWVCVPVERQHWIAMVVMEQCHWKWQFRMDRERTEFPPSDFRKEEKNIIILSLKI